MRIGHSLTWYWFRPNFKLVLQGTNMAQVRLQLCSRSHPPCSCSWCSKMRSEIEHSCSPVTTPFKLGVSFMLPILNMNEIGYGRGKHVHTQDERICYSSWVTCFPYPLSMKAIIRSSPIMNRIFHHQPCWYRYYVTIGGSYGMGEEVPNTYEHAT